MSNKFFTNVGSAAGDGKLQQFYNDEFGSLDVVVIDGKPYFPATECATALGYKNPQKAVRDHCKGVNETFTPTTGGLQKKNFIPEGDLYRLIIRSKLPAAARFEAWVFDFILPTVRKYGAYIAPDTLETMVTSPEFAIALLEDLQKERAKNAELSVKAKYCDKILQCGDSMPVSVIAKDYGMTAASFNQLLHDCRVQYNIGGTWLLYQDYVGKGYTNTRTYHYGETAAVVHTCWTQKGRLFLYELLGKYDILPVSELNELTELEAFLAEMENDEGAGGATA